MTPQEALTRAKGRISALTTFRVEGSEMVTLSSVLAAMDTLIGEAGTPTPAGPPDISVAENPHGVVVGQVWADNDRRSNGRHVKVVRLLPAVAGEPHRRPKPARAEVHLCRADGVVIRTLGRPTGTTIRLDRFAPTSNGYRRVHDVDTAPNPLAVDQ